MNVAIERNENFAESNVTVVGITQSAYGKPQYILVNSDKGKNDRLKFPGLKFRAPLSGGQSLEDAAKDRFETQTGLNISRMLGLRAIVPTRDRHGGQWIFRNVFLAVIDDVGQHNPPDPDRKVYVADPGQGVSNIEERVMELGNAHVSAPLSWVSPDNLSVARIATDIIHNFNWEDNSTTWYRKIPCVGASPLTESEDRVLGCGLSVSSIVLLYQPSISEEKKIILLKRKGDEYPGYAGGKIETLTTEHSVNVDPISCCSEEGEQEYGFSIQPRALICCACTSLDVPEPARFYNSIINYAFVAEPTNPRQVEEALKNPSKFLEGKMESYVVEGLNEHRDRIRRGDLRMPDMISIGEQFYTTTPGDKIPLTQILSSGSK